MTKMLEVRQHGTVLGNLIILPSRKMFFPFAEPAGCGPVEGVSGASFSLAGYYVAIAWKRQRVHMVNQVVGHLTEGSSANEPNLAISVKKGYFNLHQCSRFDQDS